MNYTTQEWRERWVWPVDTRVSIERRHFARTLQSTMTERVFGLVTKENPTTVHVRLDDGREFTRVPKDRLTRETEVR
jgi:hypothetical protein